MNILVLGGDGYIGWALVNRLLERGHTVSVVDDGSRRRRVEEIGSDSLVSIAPIHTRRSYLRENFSTFDKWINVSLGNDSYGYIESVLSATLPEAIIHLAEQPSAPWSMMDSAYASTTQQENVIGTLHILWAMKKVCPDAHLIKLGTMGEYGTPKCDIPEGEIPKLCLRRDLAYANEECPMQGLPFPRSAGSFYHLSKVHDTHNIIFACRTWGLRATDIMQGIVFGNEYNTRFDYDQYFGTVINRFCAQALIGHPLTVYGEGNQTRGILPLKDSLQCIELILNNPPLKGEYRTFNQYESTYTINDLATIVSESTDTPVTIEHITNPRTELERHYYRSTHQKLSDIGYKPTEDIAEEIKYLIGFLSQYKYRINPKVIYPTTTWR